MVVVQRVTIEDILAKFSLLSPYYLKLFSVILFAAATNAFYSVNYVFAASNTNYRCQYPQCEDAGLPDTLEPALQEYRCYQLPLISNNGTCSLGDVDTSSKEGLEVCDEFVYEDANSFVAEALASNCPRTITYSDTHFQNNLGCADWKRTFPGMVHSFGYMIGLLMMGPLADKIGRKKLIILTGTIAACMGLGKSIAQAYWVYIVLELVEALFGDTYSCTFMLGVEMVTKANRVSFITLMTASTSIAGILMALIAWAVPYWRYFLRVIYAPSLLFLLFAFLLDESLRWLLIKGRKAEAKDVIIKAAKASHIDLSEFDLDSIKCEKEVEASNWMDLLKMTFGSKKLVFRFAACVCMWVTGLFNKYTLLINSVELEGNKYINYALTSFSELPASFAIVFLLNRYKRRIPLMFTFLLTGVFCIGQSFVPKGNIILSISLFLVGRFMATISLAIVYLYTSELFPTHTRNTMHALCSSLGRTATLVSSQTPLMMRHLYGLPSILVGGLSLMTGIIVITLPDTADDVLPDTVRQAEAAGAAE